MLAVASALELDPIPIEGGKGSIWTNSHNRLETALCNFYTPLVTAPKSNLKNESIGLLLLQGTSECIVNLKLENIST